MGKCGWKWTRKNMSLKRSSCVLTRKRKAAQTPCLHSWPLCVSHAVWVSFLYYGRQKSESSCRNSSSAHILVLLENAACRFRVDRGACLVLGYISYWKNIFKDIVHDLFQLHTCHQVHLGNCCSSVMRGLLCIFVSNKH